MARQVAGARASRMQVPRAMLLGRVNTRMPPDTATTRSRPSISCDHDKLRGLRLTEVGTLCQVKPSEPR